MIKADLYRGYFLFVGMLWLPVVDVARLLRELEEER